MGRYIDPATGNSFSCDGEFDTPISVPGFEDLQQLNGMCKHIQELEADIIKNTLYISQVDWTNTRDHEEYERRLALLNSDIIILKSLYTNLQIITGKDGKDGKDGENGLSAYQLWLQQGHDGSVDDFLNWLKADSIGCMGNFNPPVGTPGFEDTTQTGLCEFVQNLEAITISNTINIDGVKWNNDIDHSNYDRQLINLDNYTKTLSATDLDLWEAIANLQKSNNSDTVSLNSLGSLLAWQNEGNAIYRRMMGQTGIYGVRQYTYKGDLKRPHSENGQPAHMHNHAEYNDTCGSGEVIFVSNGYIGQTRHRDYRLLSNNSVVWDSTHTTYTKPTYLSVKPVNPPNRPIIVDTGTPAEKVEAMRNLFKDYKNGQWPAGFGWTMSVLEVWFEEFSNNITDAFPSDRHGQDVSTLSAALRDVLKYSYTGFKNRLENTAFESPLIKWVNADGSYRIGVLKHRMVCTDVSTLGDLRPYIEDLNDPLRSLSFGVETTRFRIKPGSGYDMLDRLMALMPGLDGADAFIEEKHWDYNLRKYVSAYRVDIANQKLNAAYYNRMLKLLDDDAANLDTMIRGFNDPTLFVALNTRPEVMVQNIDNIDYRVSYAIPMELILRTPLEGWNPYNIPFDGSIPHEGGKGLSINDPLEGYNNQVYYLTPSELYSGYVPADVADTSKGYRFVRTGDDTVHTFYAAGQWVALPTITNVGSIRKRYAIFPEYQEGSKAWQYAEAIHLQYGSALITEIINRDQQEEKIRLLENNLNIINNNLNIINSIVNNIGDTTNSKYILYDDYVADKEEIEALLIDGAITDAEILENIDETSNDLKTLIDVKISLMSNIISNSIANITNQPSDINAELIDNIEALLIDAAITDAELLERLDETNDELKALMIQKDRESISNIYNYITNISNDLLTANTALTESLEEIESLFIWNAISDAKALEYIENKVDQVDDKIIQAENLVLGIVENNFAHKDAISIALNDNSDKIVALDSALTESLEEIESLFIWNAISDAKALEYIENKVDQVDDKIIQAENLVLGIVYDWNFETNNNMNQLYVSLEDNLASIDASLMNNTIEDAIMQANIYAEIDAISVKINNAKRDAYDYTDYKYNEIKSLIAA
jgi:hypothetical protein